MESWCLVWAALDEAVAGVVGALLTVDPRLVRRAVELIAKADGLIITAGAGMGVDSGLPDFRGPEGFWGAYPALGRAKIRFEDIAHPQAFEDDPTLAWGFYGHRLNLYRATEPHEGFHLLWEMAARLPYGAFVFTSNVDGQFQKAGYPESRIVECHGSIHYLQCLDACTAAIWPADGFEPQVDEKRCRLTSPLPRCPRCGGLARPNVLMFGDGGWIDGRTGAQGARLAEWLKRVVRPVVIEIGAGSAIPSVRRFGEAQGCPMIRINPNEWQVRRPMDVGLPLGALEAIKTIVSAL